MKQRACILMIVLICVSLLTACNIVENENMSANETTSAYLESTASNTTQTTQHEISADPENTATKFLEALINKDAEVFFLFIDWMNDSVFKNYNVQAYSFISDVDVESYKIIEKQRLSDDYYSVERFTVELQVLKSSSDIFPVGTSQWLLDIDLFAVNSYVSLFSNVEKDINIITYSNQNNIVNFCRDFSFEMECYRTVTDFNTLVPDSNDEAAGYFCQSLIRCLPLTYNNSEVGIKREQLERVAKNVLGMTELDATKSVYYDKENDLEPFMKVAGSWVTCSLVTDIYDSKTKQHSIIIDYYADTAYLLKAKTMKYTVRENSDSSFILMSTELLFDSGYQVASGLI